jgi:hypothetical protein
MNYNSAFTSASSRTGADTDESGVGDNAPFFGVRPMAVALLTTERIESILRDAVTKGSYVEHSKADGTAKAFRNFELVFQAIQKGQGGPWICRFTNTEHIAWTTDESQ